MGTSSGSPIADNIRAELARQGVSQSELADLLRLTESSMSRRLRGKTPFRDVELAQIASHLEVDVATLFRPRLVVLRGEDTG